MKGILFFLALSLSYLASAKVYYVQDPAYNANASDSNPGTNINLPWATWQKGFNTAMPGDTVYFRGGTWYPRTDIYGNVTMHDPESRHGYNGTYSKPVCFFAYPPDVAQGNMPVLDCRYTHPSTNNHIGLYIRGANHVKFKGLKVTNVQSWPQVSGEMWCAGIMAYKFKKLTLEQMTASFIGGVGVITMEYDTLYMINCDSHNNCDSLDVELPGNDGDGFTDSDESPERDSFRITYISGCRAWNNSDDGFNITTRKQLDMHDCWAWNNGDLEGDANGNKMSLSHLKSTWKRKIYNCIAAYNDDAGFTDLNLDEHIGPFMEYLNNSTYKCLKGFASGPGQMFNCSVHPARTIYRNDIAFASTGPYEASFKACDFGYPSYVVQDHNTWVQTGDYFYTEANPAYTLTADDFISLDTAQLRWPRKTDGSLPDINFMKLKSNSDLINRGVDVGLAYFGPAPDLGAFEYGSFSVELISPVNFREFAYEDPIVVQARVAGDPGAIDEVVFYTDYGKTELGRGTQVAPSVWQITWEPATGGYQNLRAVAYNTQGESATSARVIIRVNWPLHDGDSVPDNDELCKIIPNPNNGLFSLELQEPLKESSDIHIISMLGQVVAVERMDRDEIIKEMDLSALPPGFYNIRFETGDNMSPCKQTMRMVKL